MEQQTGQKFTLAVARVNRGHAVRSLAIKLGIDQRTVARLEAGEPVHPAKALVVADYFGVQVTDLMPVDREAA